MSTTRRFVLVMDQRKFVEDCPSGQGYYFQAGHPKEVDARDVDYFLGRPDFFKEVDTEYPPATPDSNEEGVSPAPSSTPLTSDSMLAGQSKPKAPPKPEVLRTGAGYNLDALDADSVIEDDILAKDPEGPWTCPVCGREGLTTKSGLRAHVGSGKCVDAAREKQGK